VRRSGRGSPIGYVFKLVEARRLPGRGRSRRTGHHPAASPPPI